jgi:hypothetical protein
MAQATSIDFFRRLSEVMALHSNDCGRNTTVAVDNEKAVKDRCHSPYRQVFFSHPGSFSSTTAESPWYVFC